jgi:hypothetical protein
MGSGLPGGERLFGGADSHQFPSRLRFIPARLSPIVDYAAAALRLTE